MTNNQFKPDFFERWTTDLSRFEPTRLYVRAISFDGNRLRVEGRHGLANERLNFQVEFDDVMAYRVINESISSPPPQTNGEIGPTCIYPDSPWVEELSLNEEGMYGNYTHFVLCFSDYIIEIMASCPGAIILL
jgi:hypothetical protein